MRNREGQSGPGHRRSAAGSSTKATDCDFRLDQIRGAGRAQGAGPSPGQGSSTAISQCSKSPVLRLATAASCVRAMAAIWQSAPEFAGPRPSSDDGDLGTGGGAVKGGTPVRSRRRPRGWAARSPRRTSRRGWRKPMPPTKYMRLDTALVHKRRALRCTPVVGKRRDVGHHQQKACRRLGRR